MTDEFFGLFERGVDRENTGCAKWDDRLEVFGRADVVPLCVADMDFAAPQAVLDALIERTRHGAFGYVMDSDADQDAVARWLSSRHHFEAKLGWVSFSPGVVDSINAAVTAFTDPGDLVAVQPPVYGPFFRAVEGQGRRLYRNRLVQTPDGWKMDLDHLEGGLRQGAKLLILCSPHNPVGRVWTAEELAELAGLCGRYGARIVADEIHADFELPGHVHHPILSFSPDAVMLISATKTFNLAALRHSSVVIADPDTRATFAAEMRRRGLGHTNLMGALAQRAAYGGGSAWLDALIEYLDGTRREVVAFLAAEVPELAPSALEGSYLIWLDARGLGMGAEELGRFFVDRAGVGLSGGQHFGVEGEGFVRMNLATPRANVRKALIQIAAAVRAARP
ncbi:MAG: putative C-S lyase [Clostridiales bacterium]|nr:putative C-S lyase [Clostridiales bacterium]